MSRKRDDVNESDYSEVVTDGSAEGVVFSRQRNVQFKTRYRAGIKGNCYVNSLDTLGYEDEGDEGEEPYATDDSQQAQRMGGRGYGDMLKGNPAMIIAKHNEVTIMKITTSESGRLNELEKSPSKTRAQYYREYRARRKALRDAYIEDLNSSILNNGYVPKTSTQRVRRFRERKRALQSVDAKVMNNGDLPTPIMVKVDVQQYPSDGRQKSIHWQGIPKPKMCNREKTKNTLQNNGHSRSSNVRMKAAQSSLVLNPFASGAQHYFNHLQAMKRKSKSETERNIEFRRKNVLNNTDEHTRATSIIVEADLSYLL